ncbi:hypothetical protein AWZ03_004902 [Drosophila navojoa]|uniref:Gustatory receptor n=1 Tax=Drosophila navojoa TaxID=7232 RepID=A0A484BIG0_DRONA|nr:hypothetical protein AWZ03_004902 [Drosophila navojoa]
MWLPSCLDRFVHPANVYECYRLIFYMALFCGLMPYYVDSSGDRLRLSYFGLLSAVLRLIFYPANFVYSSIERRSIMISFSLTNVSKFTADLELFNGMAGVVVVMATSILRSQDLLQLLAIYDGLEQEAFPPVGVNFRQSEATREIIRLSSFLFLTLLSFVVYSFIWVFPRVNAYVCYWVVVSYFSPNFIVCIVSILISGLLIKLRIYLSALNEVLKNLAHQWDTRSIKAVQKQRSLQCLDSFSMYTIVTKDPAEIIQESMEIHQLICEAAATANKYFTYQLLTIISIAFLIIVFDAYYVLETLLGKSKRESKFKTVEFVTFFSCQMILYLIAIVSIVEGSNRAIKKSEKTGAIVHSLLNKTKSAEVREKLQQFSMQLMHLKINFTAAGLFNIDRTLYFTISGALTTYLIILLQFTSNSPSSENGSGFDCCEAYHNMTNHTV